MKRLNQNIPQWVRDLKIGDRVHNSSAHLAGVVDLTTTEGSYVRIVWTGSKRSDILARTSPLWHLLELVK